MIKQLKLKQLNKILTFADKVAIASIFIISISLIFFAPYLVAGENESREAVITVRGQEVYRQEVIDNPELQEISFDFEAEGETYQGVLKMKDGAVKLKRLNRDIVPLPIHNQMGWIERNYETIVAMPVGLVINIENTAQTDEEIDVMTF